jgi:hypothetical protein
LRIKPGAVFWYIFLPIAYLGALAGTIAFASSAGKLGKHADRLNREHAKEARDQSRRDAA